MELVQLPTDPETGHCKGVGFIQVSIRLILTVLSTALLVTVAYVFVYVFIDKIY